MLMTLVSLALDPKYDIMGILCYGYFTEKTRLELEEFTLCERYSGTRPSHKISPGCTLICDLKSLHVVCRHWDQAAILVTTGLLIWLPLVLSVTIWFIQANKPTLFRSE